jgi:hypothetical protein
MPVQSPRQPALHVLTTDRCHTRTLPGSVILAAELELAVVCMRPTCLPARDGEDVEGIIERQTLRACSQTPEVARDVGAVMSDIAQEDELKELEAVRRQALVGIGQLQCGATQQGVQHLELQPTSAVGGFCVLVVCGGALARVLQHHLARHQASVSQGVLSLQHADKHILASAGGALKRRLLQTIRVL